MSEGEKQTPPEYLRGLAQGRADCAGEIAMLREADIDRAARLIAAAVFHPQPDMSGDIWRRLGPGQRRRCEDAAHSVLSDIAERAAGRAGDA